MVTYTPDDNFFAGTDSYDYTITDSDPGTAETATGTVTVTIPDVLPSLGDGAITTTSGVASAPFNLSITLGNGSSVQNVRAVTGAGLQRQLRAVGHGDLGDLHAERRLTRAATAAS